MKRFLASLFALALSASSAWAACQAGTLLGYPSANAISCSQTPVVGASASLGTLTFGNDISGTTTLRPIAGASGTFTVSTPASNTTLGGLSVSQTWSGVNIYIDQGLQVGGATSGTLSFRCAAVCGTSVLRFPAGSTDFSATGGTGQFVKQASSGAAFTVSAPTIAEIGGLGANVATFLATPSSANLAAAVTDETGSGALVFGTTPTFTTSFIGPLWIGGSSTTQTQEIRITSGAGAGSEKLLITGRSNGAQTLADIRSTATGANYRVGSAGGALVGLDVELVVASASGSSGITFSNGSYRGAFIVNGASLLLQASASNTLDLGSNATSMMVFNSTATNINISPTTASTSTTTGALTNAGGFGNAGAAYFGSFISIGTKVRSAGAAPAVSACGTSPQITGSDLAGVVLTGTGTPTSCTITFNAAYTGEPFCVLQAKTLAQLTSYTVSASAIVATTTATSNVTLEYHCIAQSGG